MDAVVGNDSVQPRLWLHRQGQWFPGDRGWSPSLRNDTTEIWGHLAVMSQEGTASFLHARARDSERRVDSGCSVYELKRPWLFRQELYWQNISHCSWQRDEVGLESGRKDNWTIARDLDRDGIGELLVGNKSRSDIFRWIGGEAPWHRLGFACFPKGSRPSMASTMTGVLGFLTSMKTATWTFSSPMPSATASISSRAWKRAGRAPSWKVIEARASTRFRPSSAPTAPTTARGSPTGTSTGRTKTPAATVRWPT